MFWMTGYIFDPIVQESAANLAPGKMRDKSDYRAANGRVQVSVSPSFACPRRA